MSSIPRFFVEPSQIAPGGQSATLTDSAAHHIRNVLRLTAGAPVTIHDGAGFAYPGIIESVGKASIMVALEEKIAILTEPTTRITVCQALPKSGEKLESVLQHGTELGVAGFVVFTSARSVARLEKERIAGKLSRWREIVRHAAEQSGRGRLPSVEWAAIATVGSATALPENVVPLILHEKASMPLRDALALQPNTTHFSLWVGPEGGFTDDEVAAANTRGATVVSLGPRVLRTETAALAAVAQLLYARGE